MHHDNETSDLLDVLTSEKVKY